MFRKSRPAADVPPTADIRLTRPTVPSRSCCCPARPAVQVIMPPASELAHPMDLWLCGHHYRESLGALLAAGAAVEDLAA